MALVTISEASRLTGKARKTIYAHIQSGKVSSKLGKDNVRRIDTVSYTHLRAHET